jgi:hypothetical protein
MGHPLGGLDHICAMVAVGLWAANGWTLNLGSSPDIHHVMALGGILGTIGISLPFVETGIYFGADAWSLIAASVRLSLVASVVMDWSVCDFPRSTRMVRNAGNSLRTYICWDSSLPRHSSIRAGLGWASRFRDLLVQKSPASLARQSCFAPDISC